MEWSANYLLLAQSMFHLHHGKLLVQVCTCMYLYLRLVVSRKIPPSFKPCEQLWPVWTPSEDAMYRKTIKSYISSSGWVRTCRTASYLCARHIFDEGIGRVNPFSVELFIYIQALKRPSWAHLCKIIFSLISLPSCWLKWCMWCCFWCLLWNSSVYHDLSSRKP